jgi:predicted metal-dependent TIM-barrel fold hydrolase
MNRIIDSHVHLRLLYKDNPERIPWLIGHNCSVISWAFGGSIGSVSDLKQYHVMRRSVFEELRRRGLDCYHLCGIHPRKIPPDLRPDMVADLLTPFLEVPECLGIGEIGLENGSPREQEILCAQVEFGLSMGRPDIRFGIHTPRKRKETVTGQLLDILVPYQESLAPVAVIDHCTPKTIGEVLSRGYHAGISLSLNKSSEDELLEMMGLFGRESHRVMCNTDSSREFFEDFVNASRSGRIEKGIAENVFYGTASRFFGIG